MRIIKVQEAADRAFQKCAPQLTKVFHNMRTGAEQIEKQLSAPVEARAAHSISTQIRDHVMGLTERVRSDVDKRPGQSAVGFVRTAIEKGDEVTVSAVLGAPCYLSGLTDEMHGLLLREWHERANPTAAKRVAAMRAVMGIIQDRTSALSRNWNSASSPLRRRNCHNERLDVPLACGRNGTRS